MKNNIVSKPNYRLLRRKVFLGNMAITAASLAIVLLLLLLARGTVGDLIVEVLHLAFGISHESALNFYQRVFRDNMDLILLLSITGVLVVLSYFLLSRFSKYFREISDGLDALVTENEDAIKLSPEMEPMERKLSAIKQTLAQRQQQKQIAEQRKNDMVMYLAHDIKTPLTSVIGYLSLLDEAPDMPPAQKAKYVSITLEKACRLERLVDEFFEITRYNFHSETLAKEHIDLYYMLAQMADEFYPALVAKGQKAVLHVPEDAAVQGDPDKLARVFNNILKNASVYSPDNSEIEIAASCAQGMVTIVFTNDGSIPQEKLASIFDKFYRLDSARSSDTGGAGLGLAIAKEIVSAHGGRISADSDGRQTKFTVELPA